jgi:hypothetical protein
MKRIMSSYLLAVVVTVAASSAFGSSGIVVVDAFNSFFAAPPKSPAFSKSSGSSPPPPPPSRIDTESWLDVLTYNKEEDQSTPSFDVLAKTIEYANCKDFDTVMSYYSDDYVFRGPIIGPITAADVRKTQEVILVLLFYLDILSVPLGIFEWLISSLPCYRERCHATKHSF